MRRDPVKVPEGFRLLRSKYRGKCSVCELTHIQPWDLIFWKQGYRATPECYNRNLHVRSLVQLLEQQLLASENMALYSRALEQEGVEMIHTRREFISKVKSLGLVNPEQEKLLIWYWRTRLDEYL